MKPSKDHYRQLVHEEKLSEAAVHPSLDDMRSKLLSQVQTIEYLALFREFIEACDSTSEHGDPTKDVLNRYIEMHSDSHEAHEKLERLTMLWLQEDWRRYLVHHMKQRCEVNEDDYIVEMRMERLVDLGTGHLAEIQSKPFDQLLTEVEVCRTMPDCEQRRGRRQELLEELRKLTHENYLTIDSFSGGGKEERWVLLEEDGLYCPRNVTLHCNIGGSDAYTGLYSIEKILSTLSRIQFEELVTDSLMPVNHERIQTETLEYGAKTANLREMSRVLPSLQQLLERNYVHINIPRFEGIPASLFDSWRAG